MRPSQDEYFIRMAKLVSERSTCLSRQVGCILINKRKHVIATGYNGVASGFDHCTECSRKVPGTNLDSCLAIHAEQNALLQCHDVYDIDTIYCTDSPCIHCLKLLMNTGCRRIVFIREYPHNNCEDLWVSLGREWVKYETIGHGY